LSKPRVSEKEEREEEEKKKKEIFFDVFHISFDFWDFEKVG
jgi:hypothetical protein